MSNHNDNNNNQLNELQVLLSMHRNNTQLMANLQRENRDIQYAIVSRYNRQRQQPTQSPLNGFFNTVSSLNAMNDNDVFQYAFSFTDSSTNADDSTNFLTTEQLATATVFLKYNNITNKLHTHCPITTEAFNDDSDVILVKQCGHYFAQDPMLHWCKNHKTCPICRYDMGEYIENTNYINMINDIDDTKPYETTIDLINFYYNSQTNNSETRHTTETSNSNTNANTNASLDAFFSNLLRNSFRNNRL